MAYELHDHAEARATFGAYGRSELTRVLSVFGGVVMCMSAMALWISADVNANPEATILRAGFTFLLIGVGFSMFTYGRAGEQEELQLDVENGMLRSIVIKDDGTEKVIRNYDLSQLSTLQIKDHELIAIGDDGQEVLRVYVGASVEQRQLDMIMREAARRRLG